MLNKIAKSKWFDVFGVLIVVAISIGAGYLTENLNDVTHWGHWAMFVPFGLISIINAGLSIMSTRLTGRLLNSGNVSGIINTILSGTIDYLLGNKGAILTYPITFIVYAVAIKHWQNTEKFKASKPLTGLKGMLTIAGIFVVTMLFSFATNYIGYQGSINSLFWLTTLIFGLSLGANILNAMKLSMQWPFWLVYNFIQLVKSIVQGNFANTGKYIYYIVAAVASLHLWTSSDKQTTSTKAVAEN